LLTFLALTWRQRKPFRTAGGESHEVYFTGDERNPRPMVASRDPQPVETRLDRFLGAANAANAARRKRDAVPLINATRTALRANPDQIDEAFFLVLQANLAAAERAGNTAAHERLSEIERLAGEVMQESLSPEDRFINQLLQAEKPQDATKLLRQNPAIITTAFVKRLNELAEQMEGDGRKPLGERLRQLGREAGAMLF